MLLVNLNCSFRSLNNLVVEGEGEILAGGAGGVGGAAAGGRGQGGERGGVKSG